MLVKCAKATENAAPPVLPQDIRLPPVETDYCSSGEHFTVDSIVDGYSLPREKVYPVYGLLTANGRPQLFFCTTARKELRRFAHAHERDCAAVAEAYGYAGELTEAEQWRVTVTVYLWRKGAANNERVGKLCLTGRAWKKLTPYCAEHRPELLELSVL